MMSHSPSTSASELGRESVLPRSLLLSLWGLSALLSLWLADDLRDWLLADDRCRWASDTADGLVELADQAGVSQLRDESESLRAALYGVSSPPGAPAPRAAATSISTLLAGGGSAQPVAAARTLAEHEVAPQPRRVLLVGASSMQFAIGQALETQLLGAYENLVVRRVGKASTGLSRPDGFNWPARLEQLLDEDRPDLVIVNFGGNDAQNIPLSRSQRIEFGSDAWNRVYAERVADFVTRIRARGAQAVMIGMPIMRSEKFSDRMRRLNEITQSATLATGGIYLDQWDLASTPDGKYRERVEEGGRSRPMRVEDGIHYTEAGGRYVVARLLLRLERHVRLTPRDATLGVVERHTFTSAALGRRSSYLAFLPRVKDAERVPLLVLLHGAGASPDELSEHMHAALARAAEQQRIAIVAPEGGAGGWWLDSPERPASRYASLVAVDLLADARDHLPVSDARGVMGISMGGHGALTIALDHPGLFRSSSSVSGVVDLTLAGDRPALVVLLGTLEAQPDRWQARSAFHRVEQSPDRARALALRLSCGAEDRWIAANRALHARLDALHIAHDYDETPGGKHDWSYWAAVVPSHVAWHARALNAPREQP
jgi:esterase/lipase superfamily enzyme